MIKRYELLEALRGCLAEEEMSLPFYLRHAGDPSFLAELPAPDQVRIRELLATLKRVSESHGEIFRKLTETVEGASQDAF
jgi:hypothetical protein